MKTLIVASALTLLAGAAVAGEGQGNPFPYRAPTQPYSLQHYRQAPGAPQNPFPFTVPGAPENTAAVIPPVGAAGEPQSANSLPVGFENGTAVGEAMQHVTPSPTRLAQPAIPAASSRHG